MKANELRLGNYIESNINGCTRIKSGIVQLDEASLYYLFDVDNDWERLKPIPLTEEWLERFGFEKENSINEEWRKEKSLPIIKEGDEFSFIVGYYENTIGFFKYVHQLQNLYFALTGKELELKE